MIQIYPDQGLIQLMKRLAANGDADANLWFLFSNEIVLDAGTVLDDLTRIVNPSPIAVPAVDFITETVAAGLATIQGDPIEFVNSSGVTVFAWGYGIMDADETMIIACARFDGGAPRAILDGLSTTVIPVLAGFSQFTQSPE